MRLNLAVLLLLGANLSAQPSQSDRYRYAPLVATAKLWNMIRYLHPRLTGDSTAWDAALIAAIPAIEKVHSDEDLAIALDSMLQTLQDPCTRIANNLPGKGVSVQSSDSNTMVIHAGNGALSESFGAGLMLQMGIPQTSNIVWDLRGSRLPIPLSTRPDIRQLSLNGIGYAFRQHSGYAPQNGTGLRYYFSSLQTVEPRNPPLSQSVPQPARTLRQVYLIDKNSAVPVQAIIDQVNGRTAILSEDPPSDRQAGFTELFNVLGRVVAEVRVADLRYSDGTTEFAPSRVVLNRGEEAVKAAVDAVASAQWGMPGARPKFEFGASGFRDMPYADSPFPSREMRIFAAIRIWGVLHYFHPHTSTLSDQWDDVLIEFLPKFDGAKDADELHRAAAEMAVRTGDATAKSPEINAVVGSASPALEVRFIDNQTVISHVFKQSPAIIGDVVVKIEGKPVQNRIDELSHYLPSNQIAHYLLSTPSDGTVNITVRGKDGTERNIALGVNTTNQRIIAAHRSGETVRVINQHTGYADLEKLESSEVDGMFETLANTTAIIFDLRGYPRDEGMAIAARLGNRNQPVFAELFRDVVGISSNGIGSNSNINFLQSDLQVPRSLKHRYAGKTVALIDDLPFSSAGEEAMCFKAANDTVLVGSATSPAFSEYSTMFDVPGGIKITFGGQMARWPNGKLLYPAIVQPDVAVHPTLAGLRAGRDEVLDAALEYLSKN